MIGPLPIASRMGEVTVPRTPVEGIGQGYFKCALYSECCQLDLLSWPSDLLRTYLSMHETLTFSWKPAKTPQCRLVGSVRKVGGT